MQTTIMFKTDKKLKVAAQKLCKQWGIPFSAALNQFLRDIVAQGEITFDKKSTLESSPTVH
jgi:addiction module RelB/DinJ family antitoxin